MKKLLIFLLIIGVLVAGVLFYLKIRKSKDFEPAIKARLSKLVEDASGGLYKLEIEGIEIDVLDSKLNLVNARLVPDTAVYNSMEKLEQAPNDLFEISLEKLSIDDINIASLATNKNIKLNRLFLDGPEIKVWHKKQSYNLKSDSSKTLFQKISKEIDIIKIDTIVVRSAHFTHYNKKSNKKNLIENVNLVFTGLLMDSSTQYDESRFLFAEDCRINVKDYTIKTADNLYKCDVSELEIRTRDKLMEMKNIALKPTLNNKDFYDKVKFERDIFNIEIAQLNFHQVDWWSLLAEESFMASDMELRDGKIKIYHDKRRPSENKSKVGQFPHQMLAKVPLNIQVDKIILSNVDVSYQEVNPKSEESGTLQFDNIKGAITNVTNTPELIKKNKNCIIDVTATFLKSTPVKAQFNFDLTSVKAGAFTVKATLGAINAEQLNKILIPLALVKMNSINIKSVDVSVRGDNYTGYGTVKLLYNDLNITALKAGDDTLKKRPILSFIANTFVIKKENPEDGKSPRIGKGVHKHIQTRSFFNLVWKSIFVAAAETVGYKVKDK